ncbi:MAG: hypothetical protein HGB11_12590 [Chlorobiales bacterium]|nr:hypothetical protein [Chlorobiales bacterium]
MSTPSAADGRLTLMGKQWEKGGYSELNKEQMAAFGKELSKLKVIDKKQDEHSAVFNVRSSRSGLSDTIRFIRFYDNWKIYEF